MFRKLVSNLPFQPSLLSEVAAYVKQLRQEQRIRKYGFIVLIIGMLLQTFVIFVPPRATLTTHTSDLIYGATTKTEIAAAYRANVDQFGRDDIQAIYDSYGIDVSHIERSTYTTLADEKDNLVIVSRSNDNEAARYVAVEGSKNGVYEFPIAKWSHKINLVNTEYPALTGISAYGVRYWLLLNGSGNIVYENNTIQAELSINLRRTTSSTTTPNQDIAYTILYKNSGTVAARNTMITADIPKGLSYTGHRSADSLSFQQNNNQLSWRIDNNKNSSLAPTNQWRSVTFTVRASDDVTGTNCAKATISAINATQITANDPECVQITPQTCPGSGQQLPASGVADCSVVCPDGSVSSYSASCASPQLSCYDITVTDGRNPKERTLSTSVVTQPNAKVKAVQYYINNKKTSTVTTMNEYGKFEDTYPFVESGVYEIKSEVIPLVGEVPAGQNCSVTANIVTTPPNESAVVRHISMQNTTPPSSDGTSVDAGDSVTYTISLTSSSPASTNLSLSGEYAFDVSDILEYATITSIGDGVLDAKTAKISWPSTEIKANETISKEIVVRITNPLPATPTSRSNPLSYDSAITATYGNTIIYPLEKPLPKHIEQFNQTLPTGSSLYASAAIVLLAVSTLFFYVRSRLLAKELSIIERSFKTGGL